MPTLSPVLSAFGAVVRELRIERGLSQEELALDAALSRDYVGRIERGSSNPTVEVIHRLASALDLRGSNLLAAAEDRAARPS